MTTRFLHTADWQLGKPFARIDDEQKRALVAQERIAMIDRIGQVAREHGAAFIVIAGDVFDSSSATKATVSAACAAIGRLGVPVFAIPGNHDHGGPGSVWEQAFFQREAASLAPNLRVLLTPEPVTIESAVLLPCPLLRRADALDPTAWLRRPEVPATLDPARPRIVLAHGSVQGFGEAADEDEAATAAANLLDLTRIPAEVSDYVALGDWHGTKQVGERAWYAGTPELDRFPKGDRNQPGHVLAVTATRGGAPEVTPVATARLGWHQVQFEFEGDAAVARLQQQIETLLGARVHQDLLRLEVRGALGIEGTGRLEQLLESLHARLLRIKLTNLTTVAPTIEETAALTQRACDPLIARVAARLVAAAAGADEAAAIARLALRELHGATTRPRA